MEQFPRGEQQRLAGRYDIARLSSHVLASAQGQREAIFACFVVGARSA